MEADAPKFILSPEHLQAIGLVAARWSIFETTIEETIWAFAEMKSGALSRTVTAQMAVPQKLEILGSLIHQRTPQHDSQWEKMAKRIRNVSKQRNHVIHAVWEKGSKPDRPVAMLLRRGEPLKSSMTPKRITAIEQLIRKRTEEFVHFVFKIGAQPDSSPDKPGRLPLPSGLFSAGFARMKPHQR